MNLRHVDGYSRLGDTTCGKGHRMNVTTGENIKDSSKGPRCLECYNNTQKDAHEKRKRERAVARKEREELKKLSAEERAALEKEKIEKEQAYDLEQEKIPLSQRIAVMEKDVKAMVDDVANNGRMWPISLQREIQTAIREDLYELGKLKKRLAEAEKAEKGRAEAKKQFDEELAQYGFTPDDLPGEK